MSEIKLLPCPFCGWEAHIEEHKFWNGRTKSFTVGTYGVRCLKCGASGTQFHKTKEEAIELWNTRKPIERIVERLNGKKKTLCGTYDFYTKPLDRPSCKIAFNNGICESIEVIKEEGGIE